MCRGELPNLILLALCWACTLSASTLLTAVGPLAAEKAGATDSVAPLAVACFLFGCALVSVPSARIFERCGRRGGFLIGCACVVIAGATGAAGMVLGELPLVFAATFLAGLGQGFGQFYRFAAMEVCAPARKPFAVTLVLSGGVIAAFAGPQLAIQTSHLLQGACACQYLGSFMMVGVIGLLNGLVTVSVRFSPPGNASTRHTPLLAVEAAEVVRPPPVPLRRLMLQPRCLVAVAVATAAHTSMVMLMSPLTVAMKAVGISYARTTLALETHFFCMFAPGFVTGKIIARIGPTRTAALGTAVFAAAAATLASGEAFAHFTAGMALCGLAWNLCFSSGTLLLSSCYAPEDAPRVQGANDFVIFLLAGAGSFASGYINSGWGWRWLVAFTAGLMLALLVLLLLFLRLAPARDADAAAAANANAKPDGGDGVPRAASFASIASSVASEASELSLRASVASEAVFRPAALTDEEAGYSSASLPRLSGPLPPIPSPGTSYAGE